MSEIVYPSGKFYLAAALLRSGKAGSNTAAALIGVLADSITQVPKAHRANLLVTSDAAGASHGPTG